ncbi:ABC-2 family transporter protein [Paenibacillus sp. S150]|uniref:ABC transporter permease n=1 Tax=Paenibacillus sp. S150 TaxID=2749826 RepID=UPI001C583810|nr:ABC-2 family transporter protein [Paenibacillus sp. S150]MBW4085039.1 ABC-2 family transporter protein [Paenibacillus sp. S150]
MSFLKISFKNAFEYRWSVFFSTISSVFSIWIMIMLWGYLYRNNDGMVAYMTHYTIVANLISLFYCRGIAKRIGDRILNGQFALDLLKPIQIFVMSWLLELGEVLAAVIVRGIPICIVYLNYIVWDVNLIHILLSVLAVVSGHIIFVLLYSILGFLAITLFDIWPFQRFLDDTIRFLGGGVIPLTIMPDLVSNIAYFLPFQYLYSFPLQILLNKLDAHTIMNYFIIEGVWIGALVIGIMIVYKAVLRKVVIQGG